MKKFAIFSLIVLCVLTLIIGNVYYENKIEAKGKTAYESFQEKQKKAQLKEEEERQALISSLNPESNKKLSIIDFLHYKSLTQDNVVVSIFGSSVAKGDGASDLSRTWSSLIENKIKTTNSDLRKVSIKNHAVGGYSTKSILENNILDLVKKDKPDLIIFETSQLNNHGQSLSMEDTLDDISIIITNLENELPNTKILVISPNPSTKKVNEVNDLGYLYSDYLSETKDFITDNGWEYVDIYKGVQKYIKDNNLKLEDTLVEDGVHPNDTGYQAWFEVLFKHMSTKN